MQVGSPHEQAIKKLYKAHPLPSPLFVFQGQVDQRLTPSEELKLEDLYQKYEQKSYEDIMAMRPGVEKAGLPWPEPHAGSRGEGVAPTAAVPVLPEKADSEVRVRNVPEEGL